MIYMLVFLGVYIIVVQFLSFHGFVFCRQRKGRHERECRNAVCAMAHKCPYNTVYFDD